MRAYVRALLVAVVALSSSATLVHGDALGSAPAVAAEELRANVAVASAGVLFADDFNGATGSLPDQSKWGDYSACAYHPRAAFGLIKCGNNETLDGNGHLVIPATPTSGSGIRARYSFVYGTMSAWIKLPAEAGYWPAFWSLNSQPDGGGPPSTVSQPVGELDAMEAYTTWKNGYHNNAHTWTGSRTTDYHAVDSVCPPAANADLTGKYNKYSATVSPGKVIYSFNDQPCGIAYLKDPARPWGFGPDVTRGNWMILDLAVGGADGRQATPTRNAQMLVDRVEVTTVDGSANARDGVYRLVNQCGGMVLAVPGGTTAIGTPLRTAAPRSADAGAQLWRVTGYGDGVYTLVNVATRHSATIESGTTMDGARIIQWPVKGTLQEQWRMSGSQLISRRSGKALSVTGGSAAADIVVRQTWPTGSCGQQWRLEAV